MLILAVIIVAGLVALSWLDVQDSSTKGTVEVPDAITKTAAGMAREARALVAEAGRPEAPKFRLVTLTGQPYTQESLRGQPALLMFWAPWCKVCQRELPVLGQFYLKQKPTPLRVLAIGFADTRGHVEEYVRAHPSTFVFPTAYD
ncbi:MAG: redoxin domain-containing protein, partial [Gammaproteobacteria bacterium]